MRKKRVESTTWPATWWCPYNCPHLERDWRGSRRCTKGLTRKTCKKAHDKREASKRTFDPFKKGKK